MKFRRRQQAAPEPQPVAPHANVIARFLTVSGAALANPEIAVVVEDRGDRRVDRYAYACAGCGGSYKSDAEGHLCELAQRHAKECTALPTPRP
ncbi:hypothetical protein [Streptomyces hoynatensis]|uniref:Uncharacterized protein n=1 Tax=Streptomyces hoynatensis TaxID=1141874 RepID=A0A3A9YXX3_9ACTN|nr:hypothetical protein [Streptomyces hoynatensis]RKN40785.1 hypothetical protein D7294_16995 [Streptomyces hoynatensis]